MIHSQVLYCLQNVHTVTEFYGVSDEDGRQFFPTFAIYIKTTNAKVIIP